MLLGFTLVFCAGTTLAQSGQGGDAKAFDHAHAVWTEVLTTHVVKDRFDYAALKKDRALLDLYLGKLHAVDPKQLEAWTRDQRYAFWINAYNAHCVALVVGEYPIESIKDIGSFFSPVWKKGFIDMPALHPSGKPAKLSLDDIEHRILRPIYKDARIHAAVNCASVSCPPLLAEAFVAERLDDQLDQQVRAWLADTSRNRFDKSRSRADVSAIFNWFAEDFVRDAGSVVQWLAKYAPAEEAEWLTSSRVTVKHLDYSWKLNDSDRSELKRSAR